MDGASSGTMQRLQSSGKNRGNLDIHSNFVGSSRPGIPPSHPNNHQHHYNSQIMGPWPISQSSGPSHSRSLSQPPVFSLDSLPPLSPLTYRDLSDQADIVSIVGDNRVVDSYARLLPSPVNRGGGENLPPRRGHRRANSEVPLGFDAMIQSSPQLMPIGSRGLLDRSVSLDKPVQIVKQELEWNNDGKKYEGDDLFNAYMNLDNMDTLNSSGTEEKDLESRASGSRVNGADSSDNEVESRINLNLHAASSTVGPGRAVGHHRSVSMDSYMGSLNFDDESMKIPHRAGQMSPRNSANLNLDFLKADFNATEMKKIGANEKLAEIAMGDPKRVKRILANRLSAARSKERKLRYISELEQKVQTLQTEATTMSAQLTMLQRDSSGLLNHNNELKFRLQAMEQQAQLKDALNNALTEELHRLKIQAAAKEHNGEVQLSNNMTHQLSLNPQMYQMHNQAYHQQDNQMQPEEENSSQEHNQMQPEQENNEAAKP